MNSRLALVILATVLFALPLQTAPAQIPLDSEKPVSSVLDEWKKDWIARNPDALRALYANDANFFTALNGVISGRDAIGDYSKRFFDQLADPKLGDFVFYEPPQESGGLAFTTGFIQYLAKGKCAPTNVGDGPCVVKGNYLMVLKQGSDGKWLIVRLAFTQLGLGSTIYTPR